MCSSDLLLLLQLHLTKPCHVVGRQLRLRQFHQMFLPLLMHLVTLSTIQPDLLPCHLDAVLKLFLRFCRSLYRRALLLQIGLMSQHLQQFWSRAYLSAELFSENSGYWPRLKAIPSKISDSQAMNSAAPTALRISKSTNEPAPITSTRPGCIYPRAALSSRFIFKNISAV